ncbi:MAG: hypothetical protein EBU61_04720, partial [Crocinitomicaceae bacterium]|nr:hypothetical protein [Crocinitomicaceae bacterium]
ENLQPFNGNLYAKISLNSADSLWVANTETQLSISKGREAYLEIDYHNTNSLTTGLIYVSPAGVTNNINIRLNAQNPERSILLCSVHSVTSNQDGSGLFLTQAVKPRRRSKKKDKRLIEKKRSKREIIA